MKRRKIIFLLLYCQTFLRGTKIKFLVEVFLEMQIFKIKIEMKILHRGVFVEMCRYVRFVIFVRIIFVKIKVIM